MITAAASLLTLALGASALVTPRQASSGNGKITSVFVLGDSYSDTCNRFRLQSNASVQAQYPFPNCPPPSVAGRASGGYQWPEYLANYTGLPVYSLAQSGATCNNTLFPRSTLTSDGAPVYLADVATQLDQIKQYLPGNMPGGYSFDVSTAALAIYIGTNDLTFFVGKLQSGLSNDTLQFPGQSLNDEAGCVSQQVYRAYEAGFRNFIVLGNIPLQRTALFSRDQVPGYGYYIQQNGTVISSFMTQLVLGNNGLQASKLPQLASTLPGANIQLFDTFNLYNDLINANGGNTGITNVTGYCTECAPGVAMCEQCTNPQDYLFYDQLHPSDHAGQILAAALQPVIASF